MFIISGLPKPWKPVFINFILQKCSKKTINYGNILENIIFVNLDIRNFENVRRSVHQFFFRVYHVYIIFYEDEERKMMNFQLIKIEKSLDMNFISVKKHEMGIWKISIFR